MSSAAFPLQGRCVGCLCVVDGEGKRRQKNVTGLRQTVTNTGGGGIVARSNSHNKLTAARRRRMIPYRQGEFIPSSFIDSLFSKVPPSPNQLSISGRADLARRVGTPRIADRARPHLHQGGQVDRDFSSGGNGLGVCHSLTPPLWPTAAAFFCRPGLGRIRVF